MHKPSISSAPNRASDTESLVLLSCLQFLADFDFNGIAISHLAATESLIAACPSCSSASGISYYCSDSDFQPPKPPDLFLLKFSCHDRKGLLHDVTEVLCEVELTIKKVKVSTTPDGKVMDLFFITDTSIDSRNGFQTFDSPPCLLTSVLVLDECIQHALGG
ncbi:ACT domain-containing protein ACR10-like [Senna tora]|uniref:ACT domain-containing protein ACR n=1 Tax=Senna tora TaxID=362788 RepID=A0A835CGB5_9FABA|nr:ACT domain-containing protein ACR10-like [Senna tora]